MAKALASLESPSSSTSPVRSLQALCTLRLVFGYTILLGACISLLGVSWDIQWHTYVGRDRTLIPPHIMSLSGLTISGLAALAAVLIETAWARRNPLLATTCSCVSRLRPTTSIFSRREPSCAKQGEAKPMNRKPITTHATDE